MPAETTIPSETLNHYRWRNKDIPWQNQIYTISFHKPNPTKDNRGKTAIQGGKLYPGKSKIVSNLLSSNPKEDDHSNIKITSKIRGSNNHYFLISLNINGLNAPIKRHSLTEWIRKHDPIFCCIQETHLSVKDKNYLRVKGWKTILQANSLKKQAGVSILISDKIEFQPKVIKRDMEGHFLLVKRKIHQEELSILNIYAPIQGHPHL